jgi:hypothetical protein
VAAGRDAGTVDVRLQPVNGQTEVTVTYQLIALTADGDRWLRAFSAGYQAFLRSWETSIADFLR